MPSKHETFPASHYDEKMSAIPLRFVKQVFKTIRKFALDREVALDVITLFLRIYRGKPRR
ncbi:hypothetical protein D9M69_611020 [compost metagenome]